MKRHLTSQEKQTLLEEFKKHLDSVTDCKVSFTKEMKPTEKIKIFYTPEAFSKSVRLIMSHTTEIAWHCLVRKKDKDYEVYDVLAYPQTVGPAHVHVKMGRTLGDGKPKDPTKYYTDWYNEVVLNMPEEEEANLCGQCHSHVYMATSPSSTDLAQQKEELELKGKTGYYLFQIWNKKLEINTFLYDLDAGVLYEKDDVEIVVEEDDFTTDSHTMLVEPEPPKPEVTSKEAKDKNEKTKSLTSSSSHKTYKYEDFDGFEDYELNYYRSAYQGLHKYIVPVVWEDGDKIDHYTEYVVEAHTPAEARTLFYEWSLENADFINIDLQINDDDLAYDFEIKDPVMTADNEVVDIDYEELIGVAYR